MIAVVSRRLKPALIIAVASVVLGVATTVVLAASTGPARPVGAFPDGPQAPASCATPTLRGTVVDVTVTDMGAMMGPGMMRPGMMGAHYWQDGNLWPGMGIMRISVVPSVVPAGPVSLRIHNTGALTHEVVVLPLPAGQYPGQRAIAADGKVNESGSVGEASRTCGADDGDGIAAGSTGWTTVTLPTGRYELLCNIAGHYGAGMWAELDTVGRR